MVAQKCVIRRPCYHAGLRRRGPVVTFSVVRPRGGKVAVVASVTALILSFVSATPARAAAALCAIVAVVVLVTSWRRSTARSDRRLYVAALVVVAVTVLLWCLAFVAAYSLSGRG